MANFSLNIYGNGDEILKCYETDHVRWGLFVEAVKLNDDIKDKGADEQIKAVSTFIKSIFYGLTDEELAQADAFDVMNTFQMIVNKANGIKTAKNG